MRYFLYSLFIVLIFFNPLAARADDAAMSSEDLMASLKGATPASVIKDATLMTMADMKVLRKGTNGWTCMVNGGVPMCVDEVGLEWVHALMSKSPPPEKISLIYMLKGDASVSNTIPSPRRRRPTAIGSRPAPI